MILNAFPGFFRVILTLSLLFTGKQFIAQKINLSDSLKYYFKMQMAPALKLDTRNSFITGSNVRVYGVKAGLIFGKKISLGIGYNWLDRNIHRKYMDTATDISFDAKLRFNYLSPYIEYLFYEKRSVTLSIPVQFGLGFSKLQYIDENGIKQEVFRQFVLMYEPAMTIEHSFLKYFAAGAGVGFRLMLRNNKELEDRFSAPIYLLRFRIIFEELYKDFKPSSGN